MTNTTLSLLYREERKGQAQKGQAFVNWIKKQKINLFDNTTIRLFQAYENLQKIQINKDKKHIYK